MNANPPAPTVQKAKSALEFLNRNRNAALFIAGFLFDFLTMQRIDSWTDLAIQLFYLASLTLLLIYQYREHRGVWKPAPRLAKAWSYNVDVLHFLYGGLLSAYVVLYFKSATGARPVVFFLVLVALMFVNEMPQVRRVGYRLRLGLYAFCVVSFLNYFFPILIGRMGALVFALSLIAAGALVWRVSRHLADAEPDPAAARRKLFAPAGAVLTLIAVLYVFRLIPPVPMSLQFQGLYHDVRRTGANYELVYERAPFYAFWRRDSRPFRSRPGDRLVFFARVFAPARFKHRLTIRWEVKDPKRGWVTSDRLPLAVSGGRAEGFRGVATKANYTPGLWRVTTETDDGRAVGILTFRVEADERTQERRWALVRG